MRDLSTCTCWTRDARFVFKGNSEGTAHIPHCHTHGAPHDGSVMSQATSSVLQHACTRAFEIYTHRPHPRHTHHTTHPHTRTPCSPTVHLEGQTFRGSFFMSVIIFLNVLSLTNRLSIIWEKQGNIDAGFCSRLKQHSVMTCVVWKCVMRLPL